MALNQYIGARYVPLITGEWDSTATYEPLTVVLYQGNSYTSICYVPSGIVPTNTTYWAITGNYNAQVEQYRMETEAVKESIATLVSLNYANAVYEGIVNDGSKDVTAELQELLNKGNVYLPSGSYLVQGLVIPANRYLIGADPVSTILYGYGDDIIKFTTNSHDNAIGNFRINGHEGYSCVLCDYQNGEVYDANNLIFNLRTSGGKYGINIANPSRGVKIYNARVSGVSDVCFNILGTDELLIGCSCQDATTGYVLQNNNIVIGCHCFSMTDLGYIIRGSYCVLDGCVAQDVQGALYCPGSDNQITLRIDRSGFYTPGTGNTIFIDNNYNQCKFHVVSGREANSENKYNANIIHFSRSSVVGNSIEMVSDIQNEVNTVEIDNTAYALTHNNSIVINGKAIKTPNRVSIYSGQGATFTGSNIVIVPVMNVDQTARKLTPLSFPNLEKAVYQGEYYVYAVDSNEKRVWGRLSITGNWIANEEGLTELIVFEI